MKTLHRQQSLYFIIIIVSLGLSLLIATAILKELFYKQVRVDLAESSRILVNLLPLDKLNNSAEMEAFCDLAGGGSGVRVTVILADGTVVGDSQQPAGEMENHGNRPEVINAFAFGTGDSKRYSVTQDRMLMYLARRITDKNGTFPGVLRVAVSLELLKNKLASMYFRILTVAAIALIISVLLSFFLVRSINRPILRLIQSARVFAEKGIWPVTIIDKPREIKLLAKTISKITNELNRRLEESRWHSRQINAVFSSMIEPLVVLDINLVILDLNPAAARLLNDPKRSAVGKNLLDTFRNSELYNFALKTKESNQPEELELQLPVDVVNEQDKNRKTGMDKSMQVHGTLITDPGGQKNRILLVFSDITRIKQLERVRKDFVANVSHELKTPITSIKGFLETLRDGGLDDRENAERFLGIAARQSDHLIAILNDLLVLSELEKGNAAGPEKSEENIKIIIGNALSVCQARADQKSITIEHNIPGKMMFVNALMLEQALINLIDNAIKYSEENSVITISLAETGTHTQIDIADQGIGIPEEDQDRVFERFYRVDKGRSREKGGTGLGLAIVKHIVKAHGGEVELHSEEGRGSRFSLIFPNDN